ncbi:MAG: sulfotransferase [Candidatus Hydrogenedentes bacterium]|nr:sulfotransferase [Candidatus Hydrogenedentota bacterium]
MISELGPASEDESASNGSVSEILAALQAAPHPQRAGLLASYLRTQVGHVLYLSADAVPMTQDLMTLGLDSLMIMEVIAGVSKDLKIKLYPREVFERPTIEALSEYIALEFDRDASAAGDASTPGDLSQPGGLRAHPNTWRKPARRIPGIVFLLSSPRSGSTLLRVMMAGHPDLFCPPELHLLPFSTMSEREQTLGATYLDEGLQRALMELSGSDAAATREVVCGLVERGAPIQEVYALLQERAGSRLLVDKSPTYAIDRENLEHAEELFEGAKYVHLVRHPYAVIESFVRTRMDKMLGLASQNPFFLAERIWTDTNRNTLEFSAAVGPQRSHLILYEDLVKDPRRTATDLCAFLGIPFHEALLRPYEGRRMTEGIHAQSLPIGDPNFHNHVGIDAALGEAWKRVRAPRALSPATVQLATEFGYELSRENSPSNAPADSFAAIEEGRL